MRTRAAAVLAALTASVAVVGVAPIAQADGYCPTNRVCMWEDTNYQGDRWVDTTVGAPGWFYDIDWWDGDNEISSIDNSTGNYIQVWGNDNPTGSSYCVRPHSRHSSLGSFDNDAESFVVVTSC